MAMAGAVVKVAISRRPRMLKADVTVRRPGARMAPAIRTSTPRKVGAVNALAKGANQWMRTGAGVAGIMARSDGRDDRQINAFLRSWPAHGKT